MSSQASRIFNKGTKKNYLLIIRIHSIRLVNYETNGGGSARCMLAEIYLPLK